LSRREARTLPAQDPTPSRLGGAAVPSLLSLHFLFKDLTQNQQ
jgi:hypothetical protein